MALSSRARSSMYDENAVLAGKMPVGGAPGTKLGGNGNQVIGKSTGGLKLQQGASSERRILSDISNTKAPLGTPKPSTKPGLVPFRENQTSRGENDFKSENLPPKAGPPQSSQKAGVRIPLRKIVNDSVTAPSARESGLEVVQQKQKPKAVARRRLGSKETAKIRLTDEQLRLADEWAKEDVHFEQVHFTGDDLEALREKMIEAEIEETVALVRNYRGGCIPSAAKPAEENVEDDIRYADGRLKLDRGFDEAGLSAVDSIVFDPAEAGRMEDPISTSMTLDEDYPTIPEHWSVRDDCATAALV